MATLHFYEMALAEETARANGREAELMPAAIQYFTLAAREENARKRAALEELRDNPPEMPAGMKHFTSSVPVAV